MKSFNLFKNNTSWLSYIKTTMYFLILIFLFALIIFFVDSFYTVEMTKAVGIDNQSQKGTIIFNFDVITFPISLTLVLFETFGIVYCLFNLVSWWKSYSKSKGERKTFNFKFCISQTVLFALILIDCCLRLVFVFMNFGKYLGLNDNPNNKAISSVYFGENPLGGFSETDISQSNFGFNTILLILFSIISIAICFIFEKKQVQLFKSELKENTKADVQKHYRELELKKRKREIEKMKKKVAKSNKIKVF